MRAPAAPASPLGLLAALLLLVARPCEAQTGMDRCHGCPGGKLGAQQGCKSVHHRPAAAAHPPAPCAALQPAQGLWNSRPQHHRGLRQRIPGQAALRQAAGSSPTGAVCRAQLTRNLGGEVVPTRPAVRARPSLLSLSSHPFLAAVNDRAYQFESIMYFYLSWVDPEARIKMEGERVPVFSAAAAAAAVHELPINAACALPQRVLAPILSAYAALCCVSCCRDHSADARCEHRLSVPAAMQQPC